MRKDISITVLMPVYNASAYLKEAIDSVLSQTFKNFELLLINDGSTDNSEEIILSYSDKRIRYFKNEKNLGLIATLNKGIELIETPYIVRADADDINYPERLQTQYDFMEKNPAIALCGSWFEIIGDRIGFVKYVENHNEIILKMLYQCHFCHPTIILRKEMIDIFEIKFDPIFIHAEDYDFFTRIAEKFPVANIQKVLVKYRIHSGSVSAHNKKIQDENSFKIKQRLFKKIGIIINEQALSLYQKIAQHEYETAPDFIENSKQLLEKMVSANDTTLYFEKEFFRQHIGRLWFNTVYNATPINASRYKVFHSSFLSNYCALSLVERGKLILKSIMA